MYEDTNEDGDYDEGTDTVIAEYLYDAGNRRTAKIVPDGDDWRR